MLARRRTTILPAMTLAEALETTRIHRVAGLSGDRTALVTTRPLRAPQPCTAMGSDPSPASPQDIPRLAVPELERANPP
jgi:hypothetical protein